MDDWMDGNQRGRNTNIVIYNKEKEVLKLLLDNVHNILVHFLVITKQNTSYCLLITGASLLISQLITSSSSFHEVIITFYFTLHHQQQQQQQHSVIHPILISHNTFCLSLNSLLSLFILKLSAVLQFPCLQVTVRLAEVMWHMVMS